MTHFKGTVLTNRNAPCDPEWKSAYATTLKTHGFQTEHLPQYGLRDAVRDGQPRVFVDIKGAPTPQSVAIVLLEPVAFPSGVVGSDFGSHGWRIARREILHLEDSPTIEGVATLICTRVKDFFTVAGGSQS